MISAGPARSGRVTAVAVAAAAAAIAAVAFAVVGAHVRPDGHAHGWARVSPGAGPTIAFTQPPQASPSPRHVHPSAASEIAGVILYVGGGLATLAGLVILVLLIKSVMRRPNLRRRSRPNTVEPADYAPDDLAAHLGSAVDEALEELNADRPVSDAIIRCWLRLEAAAATAGIAPVASDTPQEAVNRVLAAGAVRSDPLEVLAALYREARFSRHELGPQAATAAREALSAIMDDLRPVAQGSHGTP